MRTLNSPPNASYQFTEAQLAEMGFIFWRHYPDGEWVGVASMTFGKGRICAGVTPWGYEDSWCYDSIAGAIAALSAWEPSQVAEPNGWFRQPLTGRRRPDGDASKEYVAF